MNPNNLQRRSLKTDDTCYVIVVIKHITGRKQAGNVCACSHSMGQAPDAITAHPRGKVATTGSAA